MIGWITDHVPLWVWLLILGGGGGAALALIPGAAAIVVSLWTTLPPKVRWFILAVGGLAAALYAAFRRGRRSANAEQERRDQKATRDAREIRDDIRRLDDTEIDKRLEKNGDFWKEPPPRRRSR